MLMSICRSLFCCALAAISFAGCAHSPGTVTVKTPEGKEEVMAPLPATVYSMARMLESQGRHQEAEAMLRQLIAGHPDFLPAYQELAGMLVRQHRLDDGLKVIEAGLKKAPRDGALLNNAGMCRLLKKDYAKAADYFQRATAANPADTRAQANLALSLGMQGYYQRAREIYLTFLPPEDAEQNIKIIQKSRSAEAPQHVAPAGEKNN
ncbi:tetratricopeptide repeat protein [bacterium]|nr:tetratricopeptide repeat protein [bacterium]